jgi:hypothetical protein
LKDEEWRRPGPQAATFTMTNRFLCKPTFGFGTEEDIESGWKGPSYIQFSVTAKHALTSERQSKIVRSLSIVC